MFSKRGSETYFAGSSVAGLPQHRLVHLSCTDPIFASELGPAFPFSMFSGSSSLLLAEDFKFLLCYFL